jgi:hypothetical protein
VVVRAEPWWRTTRGGRRNRGTGCSSEQPPGRHTAGVEQRHGVVVGAVTDGDREREERTRCSAD